MRAARPAALRGATPCEISKGEPVIELRPLSLAAANRAVSDWHSHHKPVVGHRFSVGAFAPDLVAAVIVGNPKAQALCDGVTFEVVRLVCSSAAPKNTATRLLGAAWRASKAMGVLRLVSYTRADETGHCYLAASWSAVATVKGRAWTSGNKTDRWLPGLYQPTTELIDRVRWEISR